MSIDRKQLISHIPIKYLAYGLWLSIVDAVKSPFRDRFVWKVTEVGNSLFPDADLRTFYELENIRDILKPTVGSNRLARAAEVGCGYGRITPVLCEFADEVMGLEREPSLVDMARSVVRDVEIRKISRLAEVGDQGPFDLQMICTVLQHISDDECAEVLASMKRASAPNGFVLLVENTDQTGFKTIGDPSRGDKFLSRPRAIEEYRELMSPFEMIDCRVRRLERGNDMAGNLMLFRSPQA